MKKKLLNILACLSIILIGAFALVGCGDEPPVYTPKAAEVWDGTISAALPEANADNEITITTAEQLARLAANVNNGETYEGYTIILGASMDMQNKEWKPIGYGVSTSDNIITGKVFSGIFDGNGKTIYNLKITTFKGGAKLSDQYATGVGLFGHIFDAEVKKLTIDTAKVTGHHYVGTAVGYSHNSTISDITVKNAAVVGNYGDSEENGDKVGGVVGYAATASTLTNCSISKSTVKAVRDAGQVLGHRSSTSTVTDCTATETIVSHNSGSAPAGYEKDGRNITNDIIGAE